MNKTQKAKIKTLKKKNMLLRFQMSLGRLLITSKLKSCRREIAKTSSSIKNN